MKAFNNDPEVKARCLARLNPNNPDMLDLLSLIRQENMYGGAFNDTNTEPLGIPVWLARLVAAILDGQPSDNSLAYIVEVVQSIPVGADVSIVEWQLAIVRANRTLTSLKDNTESYALQAVAAITQCKDYCNSVLEGTETETQRLEALRSAQMAAVSARIALSRSHPAAWSAQSAAQSAFHSLTRSARSTVSAAQVFPDKPEVDHYVFESTMLAYLLTRAPH